MTRGPGVKGCLDSGADVELVLAEPGPAVTDGPWARIDLPIATPPGHTEVRAAPAVASWSDPVSHVAAGEALVRTAGELAERHGLRAADAIHLASATLVRGAGTAFVSVPTGWARRPMRRLSTCCR